MPSPLCSQTAKLSDAEAPPTVPYA